MEDVVSPLKRPFNTRTDGYLQALPVLPNVAARDSRSREASTYEGHSISLDVCGLSVKYVPESETAQLRAWHYESSGVTAQSRTGDCSLSCMI